MKKAVIYDMDGLIIDSEHIWNKAEINIFGTVGVHLTEESCREPTGLRVDEVVEYWYHKYPWKEKTHEQVIEEIYAEVIKNILLEGKEKRGVRISLDLFSKFGFKIALASSSPMVIIETVLNKFSIKEYFQVIYSAEAEEYGKPHPGVYITTAKKLGVSSLDCIALEDSINGIISAKAAKMKCIAIPDILIKDDKKLGIADLILTSLDEITEEIVTTLL